MSRRAVLTGFLLAPGLRGASAGDGPPAGDTDAAGDRVVGLGDTTVRLVQTRREPRGLTYVSLHENEQTAVAAARHAVGRHGGRLVELRAQRRRLVSFAMGSEHYTFDPNRIFTGVGIDKTLRRYGRHSPAAHAEIARLASTLVGVVADPRPIAPLVAVHNNTAGGLSVESYRSGGALQAEAAAVAASPRRDAGDFFLVTDAGHFDRLRDQSFNVVLQRSNPSDDGSLSVYCQGRLPYVNVEARFGHLDEQIRMLDALQSLARAPA